MVCLADGTSNEIQDDSDEIRCEFWSQIKAQAEEPKWL